jgi:hypothetical protein
MPWIFNHFCIFLNFCCLFHLTFNWICYFWGCIVFYQFLAWFLFVWSFFFFFYFFAVLGLELRATDALPLEPLCQPACMFTFETGSRCIAQAGHELSTLLSHPPECWDYRHAPPCLACWLLFLYSVAFFLACFLLGLGTVRVSASEKWHQCLLLCLDFPSWKYEVSLEAWVRLSSGSGWGTDRCWNCG